MWQTIVTVILLVGAAVYTARHFLRVYRTGNDGACSGCSSECCGAAPRRDSEGPGSCEEKERWRNP